MLHNPLELEFLVNAYETDREDRRQATSLLRQADRGGAGIRRAAGFRLIALGERLAGGPHARRGPQTAPLLPVGNVAR